MSRYTGPKKKKMQRFGLLPESPVDLKTTRRRKRKSDYAIRLGEKQKLKFIYGVQEKQFRRYFQKARKDPKNTGHMLLQLLERRLDNVVYRLGFAKTRPFARQLVAHGHILVGDQKINIPSFLVETGVTVTLKPASLEILGIQEALKESKERNLAKWLTRKGPVGMVKSLPQEGDLREDIDTQLIIEYYSR